jgi:transposase
VCHTFRSAEQLAAYLVLMPMERRSGISVLERARLSKAGLARVHAALYMDMVAVVAARYNPHIKSLYERLLARAGQSQKAALGAAIRKLVHLCFGVLRTRQSYQANYAVSA